MAASNTEMRLAQKLAAPFALPGRSTQPLSFRLLPEGGMVVISSDGRKLWFTLEEVNAARQELGLPVKNPAPGTRKPQQKPADRITATPCGGSRDGQSEMIMLPPDLKHLEKLIHDKPRRP
jgi:hypothetical protein